MQTNNGKQSHIHPCPAVLSRYLEQWTPLSLSLFSSSLLLMREKRIFEKETKEKVSPSSRQKCTTNNFLAYTQTKKNTTFTFHDGGESKRGVRSVHYTKVESAIESLLSRKATLYSGSHGENKRYTGVIPLSLGAFSIPASIRNSL